MSLLQVLHLICRQIWKLSSGHRTGKGQFSFQSQRKAGRKESYDQHRQHIKKQRHYFASMWDECNCVVVWTFFGTALLWDGNENYFQSCGHCWVFQISWHIECSTFTASSFRIWNSSTWIPSPPLALFVVILPKAHLTSDSRMSGSRWMIAPMWLSGSWRSFLHSSVYSCTS